MATMLPLRDHWFSCGKTALVLWLMASAFVHGQASGESGVALQIQKQQMEATLPANIQAMASSLAPVINPSAPLPENKVDDLKKTRPPDNGASAPKEEMRKAIVKPLTAFEQNMQRIFANDNVADIRVVFGYDNSSNLRDVYDPGRAEKFMKHLLDRGYVHAAVSEEIAEKLGVPETAQNLRIIQGQTPDGRLIRISVMWSSATDSSAKNMGSEYTRQLRCSEEALSFLQKAATDAEVMIYIGHSREGGGPDTFPPESTGVGSDGYSRVNFSYYRKTRQGLNSLAPYLSKATATPNIILWTSCKSDKHFLGWFKERLAKKRNPTSLILSTRFTQYMPWLGEIKNVDEGLMATISLLTVIQQNLPESEMHRLLEISEIESAMELGNPAWKLRAVP